MSVKPSGPSWWQRLEGMFQHVQRVVEKSDPLPPDLAELLITRAHLDIRPTTQAQAIANALSWVGKPSTYRLGGGADVHHPSPFAIDGTCDCSGFTAWVTGQNRIQSVHHEKRFSFYTDNIIADATGPTIMYAVVPKSDRDVEGCLIVKPGIYVAGRRIHPGHVGIITRQSLGFGRGEPGWWRELDVVHCTPNRGLVNSVRKTDAAWWRKTGYIVRPLWYVA